MVDQQQEERKMAPRRIGLSGVEVVSPELRQALGIKRPTNLLDPAQTAQRPGGLGAIFFPESKIQSAQARAMIGSGITGEGVSPGIQQALTGSPIGATSQADLIDVLNERQDPIKRSAEIVDDFRELNDAQVINNALRGLESDIDPKAQTAQQTTDKSSSKTSEVIDTSFDSDFDADKPRDQNLTAAQQATKTALDQCIKEARPGVSPQNYDDYIKEFGEATGLDISGDPDTKQALMSFGLALMQNRAGKGFNLSNILGSVGEAGEAALPEFSKAVSEAKAIRAKAGAFAISRKKEDQAAAMNRSNYYIIPKGTVGGIKGLAQNFEKGQNVRLNSFELKALDENEKFNEQYEIVPDSVYKKAAEAYFKTPEYGDKFLSGRENLALFNDAPDDLSISIARVNQNYKGPDMPKLGFYNAANYEDDFKKLERVDKDLDKIAKKLSTAFRITDEGKVDFFGQMADGATSLARAFAINLGDRKATDTATVTYLLESIAAQKAPQILGEAGKTISDADRERVQRIVGQLKRFTDPETAKLAMKEVYELIVIEGKMDVQQGLSTLNRYAKKAPPKFGVRYNVSVGDDGIFDVQEEPE